MKEIIPKLTTCTVVLLWNSANTRHISAVAVKYQLNKTIITACAQTTSAKKWWNEKVWPSAEHHAEETC